MIATAGRYSGKSAFHGEEKDANYYEPGCMYVDSHRRVILVLENYGSQRKFLPALEDCLFIDGKGIVVRFHLAPDLRTRL